MYPSIENFEYPKETKVFSSFSLLGILRTNHNAFTGDNIDKHDLNRNSYLENFENN